MGKNKPVEPTDASLHAGCCGMEQPPAKLLNRRTLLAGAAGAGTLALLTACAQSPTGEATPTAEALPQASLGPLPVSAPGPQIVPFDASRITKQGMPIGPINSIDSGGTNVVAWTVDDGFNSDVTVAYANYVRDSGARMTFFICGEAPGWTNAAPILKPLVESGQVQIANHTRTHSDLQKLSDAEIQADLMDNHAIIQRLYGVDARPFFRPPFGSYNSRVVAAAAKVGYSVPVLWSGTLSDSGEIDPDVLMQFADKYMQTGKIVLGHANWWPVTTLYPEITRILEDRDLMTVTLNDIFRA